MVSQIESLSSFTNNSSTSEEYVTMISDSWSLEEYDPLNALHEYVLASNPEMDLSILTDDELISLLKNAKDTKDLAFLNLNMSKQITSDGKSIVAVNSPAYSYSQSSSNFSQSEPSQLRNI